MNKDKKQENDSKKLDDLEKQVNELTEALQRERADSINLRRRVEEDRSKLGNVYKAAVVRELLPALDNLERALKHVPKDHFDHDYVKGIKGVAKQFDKALEDLGVQKIKTVGEIFDPKYHEAVSMEEDDGDIEVVSEELQAGYRLGDEIVRHAFVRVKMQKQNAKPGKKDADEDADHE
jgi:molecular chaperone GrpE